MPIRCVAILFLVAITGVASADDTAQKDRDTALWLSAGGTAISLGLVGAAAVGTGGSTNEQTQVRTNLLTVGLTTLLVTPSLGEFYAGKYLTVGLGLRAAGAATVLAGIVYSYCNDSTCSNTGHTMIAIGVLGAAAGIVYDIATARSAVDDYNASHRARIVPMVLQSPSGPAVGVGVGGPF